MTDYAALVERSQRARRVKGWSTNWVHSFVRGRRRT